MASHFFYRCINNVGSLCHLIATLNSRKKPSSTWRLSSTATTRCDNLPWSLYFYVDMIDDLFSLLSFLLLFFLSCRCWLFAYSSSSFLVNCTGAQRISDKWRSCFIVWASAIDSLGERTPPQRSFFSSCNISIYLYFSGVLAWRIASFFRFCRFPLLCC